MSFRLKTILGIGAIEILLLSVLIISGLHYLRTSNEEQLFTRAENAAQLFATMTADPVVAVDLATLDVMVEQALKNRGMVYVRVRGANGDILAQGGDVVALAQKFKRDFEFDAARVDGRIDVAQRIDVNGELFGRVEIGINAMSIEQALTEARQWMLSVAGVEVVLVALFSYALGSLLTRRLTLLQHGARQVAQGKLGYLIEVSGRDELAETAKGFNAMSSQLALYARNLEDARAQAEAGRVRAETILGDAIESLSQGVLVVDEQKRVLHMNHAYSANYRDAALGIAAAATLAEVNAQIAELIDAQEVYGDDQRRGDKCEWTSRLKDGRHILHTCRPTESGGQVFVETDITPIYAAQARARQLEMELMQSQKLESLGTLAGGIAHEINTPIQYIGDNLRFLDQSFQDMSSVLAAHSRLAESLAAGGDPATVAGLAAKCRELAEAKDMAFLTAEIPQAARQSIDGVEHVAGIVRAMKEFSHPTSKEMAPVDLNRVVSRAVMVCRNEWKHVADLDLDLQEGLSSIEALEGDLNQVVLNLVVNAAQAIQEKGGSQGRITIATRASGDTVRLSIADTGSGIPDAVRDRIFDPFFTTKDVGKGTGQGLTISRDIVARKHGGKLEFETAVGQGTTFHVSLPVRQPSPQMGILAGAA